MTGSRPGAGGKFQIWNDFQKNLSLVYGVRAAAANNLVVAREFGLASGM
jgi:hypothetical protein